MGNHHNGQYEENCTQEVHEVHAVRKSSKPRARVEMTDPTENNEDDMSLKDVLTTVLLNSVDEEHNSSFHDSANAVNFSSFVDIVDVEGSDQQWYVFHDNYFVVPAARFLMSSDEEQSPETFMYKKAPNNNDNAVLINADYLSENFYKIINTPLRANGSDQDVVEFIRTYARSNDLMPDIFSKEESLFSEVYVFLYNTYRNQDIVYFEQHDLYVKPKTNQANNVYIGESMFGPKFIYVPVNTMAILNGQVAEFTSGHKIIDSEYVQASELGFYKPEQKDIQVRIAENKAYLEAFTKYRDFQGIGYVPSAFGPVEKYIGSRVMVDNGALFFTNPEQMKALYETVGFSMNDGGGVSARKTVSETKTRVDIDHIPNDSLMQMMKYEVCYDLAKKTWFIGSRENLGDIVFRKDAFDKLQMDENKKNIIQKICSSDHQQARNIDFIDGKGGGNVFLLHGTPGTGKTLTAEAISELLEKPLYKVNISEYDSLDRLEEGMELALRYAERWGATLLIDEADVALEKRDSSNIERNAIVAIFLRLIEYYAGTMFLTSNRASEFDEAFKSRITFAIHYKAPDENVRNAIWTNILSAVRTDITTSDIDTLSQYDLNGRQIKNIINTSSYMSDDNSVLLEHVNTVLDQTIEFDAFVRNGE